MPTQNSKGSLYNEQIKNRFLANSGWGDEYATYFKSVFKLAARLEYSLNKDIYEFTAGETADLLRMLQLKTRGHVIQIKSSLGKYVGWAYQENLTTNPVNYFESLYSSANALEYVSPLAKEMRRITEEELCGYETQLTQIGDYVDAALMRGCFIGLRGTKFKDLLGLTIDMVKPNSIELDDRTVSITDYEHNLFVGAHNQPEMVPPRGENNSRRKPIYFSSPYVFKASNTFDHIKINSLQIKMMAVSDYVGNPFITASNLYYAGMADALSKLFSRDNVEAESVFAGRSQTYFDIIKKQFGYSGATRYLKYKLHDYFVEA